MKSVQPSRSLLARAEAILPQVDRRLKRVYGAVPTGSTPLGNKRNPLDELIYIQLSVRTREAAYLSTYQTLRRLVGGSWERLLEVPDDAAIHVLGPAGMARVKLERLRGQLVRIAARFGRITLLPLREQNDQAAEQFLRELPGVGPKVARCVLLYSLDRDVFPVDSNCHRVLGRLGFLPAGIRVKAAHDFLQRLVPLSIRRSLHVNLIRHGRDRCAVHTPECEKCVLLALCPTGKRIVTSRMR